MPQDKLFALDPINTNLTAPVAPGSLAVQGAVDTSLTTQTRSAGIRNFAESLSKLAVVKREQVIHNDVITAELAAAYEKAMPGGLQPEAQLAFTRAVDTRLQSQVIQQIKDFTKIEGAELLNDNSKDRLARATEFKNRQLEILNIGKAGISQANAARLFPNIEATYREAIAIGNVALAADKQQEALSTSSSAIGAAIRSQLNVANSLLPTVDSVGKDGNPISAEDFVTLHNTNKASAVKSILSSGFFNRLVKETKEQNLGADILDIKAVAFANFTQELIEIAQTNPAVINEQVIQNILDNVQGQTKGSTLSSEMLSSSDFGKVIKTINDNFHRQLNATLTKIETDQASAVKARDDDLSNDVMDNIDSLTEEEAIAKAKGIDNPSEQRSLETYITTHFKEGPKLGLSSQAAIDLGFLIEKGTFTNEDGSLDILRIRESSGIYNLTDAATNKLIEKHDPQKKLGKKRKELFDNTVIKTSLKRLHSVATDLLTSRKFSKLADIYGGIDTKDPVQVAMFKKMLGKTDISDQVINILQAELQYSQFLEDLVVANPDAPIDKLITIAKDEFTKQLNGLTGATERQEAQEKEAAKITPINEDGTVTIAGSQFSMEALASSGATTFTKATIPTSLVKTSVYKRLFNKEPRAPLDIAEVMLKEIEAIDQINIDRQKLLGITPASTREKIGLIQKYQGIPNEVVKNRFKDNPDAEVAKVKRMVEIMKKEKIEQNRVEGNSIIQVGSSQLTVDEFNTFTDKVENFIWKPFLDFFNDFRVFSKDDTPDRTTPPKIEVESFEDVDIDSINSGVSLGVSQVADPSSLGVGTDIRDVGADRRKAEKLQERERLQRENNKTQNLVEEPEANVSLTSTLGTPEERLKAFNEASPDQPPSERVKLRELQDIAQFQDNRNVGDVLAKTSKRLANRGINTLKDILNSDALSVSQVEAIDNVTKYYATEQAGLEAYSKRAEKALEGNISSKQQTNLKELLLVGEKAYDKAFAKEVKSLGLTKQEFKDYLTVIYAGETALGIDVKKSSSGAQGHLQVFMTTWASTIAEGQFGTESAKLAGIEKVEFEKVIAPLAKKVDKLMKQKKVSEAKKLGVYLETLIQKKQINFIAGMSKLIQALQANRNRKP